MAEQIITGINSFLSDPLYNKINRHAIVTNDVAKTTDCILSRVALLQNEFNLVKIFSPEHGINVKGADGVYQKNSKDKYTGLPVISLYGDHLFPKAEDLSDVDIVLFDIPDVGCRFYTYLWTMTYVMEACAKYGKQLIILDRPNPLGGILSLAEGPMLDEETCSSFIGRWSIPVRHSCTLGELALYFSATKIKDLDLKTIPVLNWQRKQFAGTPGFDFYPTSPAIKNSAAALLYPGTGLLEGIYINEGRGTENPFSIFGAPWIEAEILANAMQSKKLTGIIFNPCKYIPTESLYKGEKCNGLELIISDTSVFNPVNTGIELLKTLFQLFPGETRERLYKTLANPSGRGHLDKLIGINNSFEKLKSGIDIQTNVSKFWPSEITPFLLYK